MPQDLDLETPDTTEAERPLLFDPTLVRYLSTRIAVMESGRLVETGDAEPLCAAPQMPCTQKLLAATPELPSAFDGSSGMA